MLVTSAVRRARLSGGSTSSLRKASPKASSGLCKAQVSTKIAEQEATAVLKSGFPQGFHESAFTGRDEVVGEQHCHFLDLGMACALSAHPLPERHGKLLSQIWAAVLSIQCSRKSVVSRLMF